jgi:hypothetical protein
MRGFLGDIGGAFEIESEGFSLATMPGTLEPRLLEFTSQLPPSLDVLAPRLDEEHCLSDHFGYRRLGEHRLKSAPLEITGAGFRRGEARHELPDGGASARLKEVLDDGCAFLAQSVESFSSGA